MIEVAPGFHVGTQKDYEWHVDGEPGWFVVQACREPYHRRALGYTGSGAPKHHPEYLVARREQRLILNLIDAADPKYIRKEIIDAALVFIEEARPMGRLLVHCNQGRSRSPTIAMLALARTLAADFADAERAFQERYPAYAPATGMRTFARDHWALYRTA